jgi:hypothetical protein
MTNDKTRRAIFRQSRFVIISSFVIRHSSFLIPLIVVSVGPAWGG